MKKTKQLRSVHFLGIKGTAMSGLAIMAKESGYTVTGSDIPEQFPTDATLAEHEIAVQEGFSVDHLSPKPDLVVVSAAFGPTNIEYKTAKSLRIPIKTQSEFLADLMAGYETVGVTGVHGKTTTTALLALILQEAGFSPSYAIGTDAIPGLEGNGHIGTGKHFVVEADEYKKSEQSPQPKFLDLPLKHLIVTSIELDHPDMYQSAEDVYQAFYQLTSKVPRDGTIVACSDWPLVRRLVSRRADRPALTYGFEPGAHYQIVDFVDGAKASFSLKTATERIGPFRLALPGRHGALNAAAALILAQSLGVSLDSISKTLEHFTGPSRRFQLLGEYNGVPIIDDFAHHPTAIRYLLDAARHRFPGKRLIVVFQPHTYSRTGKLLKEFATSLLPADKIILLNIYASAREKSGYVSIKDLIVEIRRHRPDVEFRANLAEVAQYLEGSLQKNDVVLLIGAGDVYKIYDLLTKRPTS
jgi:UDP-N-acetylmuramate--alanine ligase